jgi:hypothetical protein
VSGSAREFEAAGNANADQWGASLATSARAGAEFFKTLLAEGFSREEAMTLVGIWATALFESVSPPGNDE